MFYTTFEPEVENNPFHVSYNWATALLLLHPPIHPTLMVIKDRPGEPPAVMVKQL